MSSLVETNVLGGVVNLVGFTGIWLSGNKRRIGWAVGFASEGLWALYAVALSQWVLLPACAAWAVIYARNWARWGRTA